MSTYEIDKNVWLTDGTIDGKTITTNDSENEVAVKITPTKIEHSIDSDIIVMNIPVAPAQSEQKFPNTKIVDLNQLKEVITVTGRLTDEQSKSCVEKKEELIYLSGLAGFQDKREDGSGYLRSGPFKVAWSTGSETDDKQQYNASLKKVKFTESPDEIVRENGSVDTDRGMKVKTQMMIGKEA